MPYSGQGRGPGRPIELTDELTEEICRHIAAVYYLDPAALACDVPARTARRWMARGRDAAEAIRAATERGETADVSENDALCMSFWQRVLRAQSQVETRHAGNVATAAFGKPGETVTTERILPDGTVERTTRVIDPIPPNYKASTWYLEHAAFKRWGRKERLEHTGADGAALSLAVAREILAEAEGHPDDTAEPSDA